MTYHCRDQLAVPAHSQECCLSCGYPSVAEVFSPMALSWVMIGRPGSTRLQMRCWSGACTHLRWHGTPGSIRPPPIVACPTSRSRTARSSPPSSNTCRHALNLMCHVDDLQESGWQCESHCSHCIARRIVPLPFLCQTWITCVSWPGLSLKARGSGHIVIVACKIELILPCI